MPRKKKNPLFGETRTDEVFEDEQIAGYKIELIRSCGPGHWRVTHDEDGDVRKRFKEKGKALVWVGKQIRKKQKAKQNPKRPSLVSFTRL